MNLRFKILLALMLPIIAILIETIIDIIINSVDRLPTLNDYQQQQEAKIFIENDDILNQGEQLMRDLRIFQIGGKIDDLQDLTTFHRQPQTLIAIFKTTTVIPYNQDLTQLGITLISVFFVVSFGINLKLISKVFLVYVWRTSIVVGLSLEIPVQTLIEIIGIGINDLEKQEFTVNSYVELFNSKEIASLFSTMIHFVNNIKYSNNKLLDIEMSEARNLIAQCQSAEFYKKYENLTAVGICANNISRIHMKNKRFMEAMNEQELSIMIANQDLEELQQYKKLYKENEKILISSTMQKQKNTTTQKIRMLDQQWNQKFQNQMSFKKIKNKKIDFEKENVGNSNYLYQSQIQEDRIKASYQGQLNHFNKSFQQQNWIKRNDLDQDDQKQKFENAEDQNSQSISPSRDPYKSSENPLTKLIQNISSNRLRGQSHLVIQQIVLNQNEIQIDDKMSSLDNHETQYKLIAIKNQIKIMKLTLLNRKYQLATILFNYSLNKTLFSNESVYLFTQIFDESQKLPSTTSLQTLQINTLTKKAICLIRKGEYFQQAKLGQGEYALRTLIQAEKIYNELSIMIQDKLIGDINQNKLSEEIFFVDIFKDIPLEVLKEKITNCFAMLDMMNGQFYQVIYLFKQASIKFTQILSSESYHDPEIQMFSIKALKNIFELYKQPVECLLHFQDQSIEKDLEIIVLIDYTTDMSTEQFTLSHTMCKYILDQLRPQDQIGLYAFNEILYEAFPLQKKIAYRFELQYNLRELLEQIIKQLLIYPGGRGNLFKLLQLCAAFLFDLQSSYSQKKLMKYVNMKKIQRDINSVQDLKLQIPQFTNKDSRRILKSPIQTEPIQESSEKSQSFGQNNNLLYTNRKSTQILLNQQNKMNNIHGDLNEECIDEILQLQECDIFSDEEDETSKGINFFEVNYSIYIKIDEENILQEEPDKNKIKYICLFSEGVKKFNQIEFEKLKNILMKKNINLMVFNIANQNANMLYLKMLSEATDQSQFFTSDKQMINFFQAYSQNQQSRKTYLEFF